MGYSTPQHGMRSRIFLEDSDRIIFLACIIQKRDRPDHAIR
ncbi:hypothetical protein [Tolypothrix sp. NIES-4075]|nr:hypothetical protein [Tolypothrix sp. NIES-4075]